MRQVDAALVQERNREIGVRMALGASRGTVLGLIMRQAGAWTFVGMGLGLLGASALARYVSTLLFGVSASDPAIYAAVCLVLALVAFAAVSVQRDGEKDEAKISTGVPTHTAWASAPRRGSCDSERPAHLPDGVKAHSNHCARDVVARR